MANYISFENYLYEEQHKQVIIYQKTKWWQFSKKKECKEKIKKLAITLDLYYLYKGQ